MFINASTERGLDAIAQRAADVRRAFTPGALPKNDDVTTPAPRSRPDLDPMSVSAPANDFFITTDDRGRTSYTRDGGFSVADGTVVASNGRAVLGYTGDGNALSELHLDPVDETLGRVRNLRVSANGSVEYDRASIDPRTQSREIARVTVGRIALARFPAGTKLATNADGTSAASPDVSAHVGRSCDGNFGAIAPMRREESRVDLDQSLAKLHDAYVAFDALQAAHKAQGHVSKTVMDLLK